MNSPTVTEVRKTLTLLTLTQHFYTLHIDVAVFVHFILRFKFQAVKLSSAPFYSDEVFLLHSLTAAIWGHQLLCIKPWISVNSSINMKKKPFLHLITNTVTLLAYVLRP